MNGLRAFYQIPFSEGLYTPLKQKLVYPRPIVAGVLGHLKNILSMLSLRMQSLRIGIKNAPFNEIGAERTNRHE